METEIINESGYEYALLGMALSYYSGSEPITTWWTEEKQIKAAKRARLLCNKQGGHNKFLESIQVWLYIKAPRGWWQEFDTYRSGITKQSASTMHTIKKRFLTADDFDDHTQPAAIDAINQLIAAGADVNIIKANLPEGFLQDRVVCTNYKTLQNIIGQRINHKYRHWRRFCDDVLNQIQYPELIYEPVKHHPAN